MQFKKDTLHIFLDLEQSLVESWDHPLRMNTNKELQCELKVLKRLNRSIEFHLFSFAVCNEDDVNKFNSIISPHIEEFFKIKFTHIISKDEVLDTVKKVRNIQVLDEFELSQLFGKANSFIDFCKYNEISNTILFDDTVDDTVTTIQKNRNSWRFETVNVIFQ